MDAVGIIAEYNPFHTGHIYHIHEIRRRVGSTIPIVCAMSGNWVQRGDAAIVDKWTRASLALQGGADLILEIPTPWAISSAEGFALGGVSILEAAGIVNILSFGSESEALPFLRQAALLLDSPAFQERLRAGLDEGLPFAAARQNAMEHLNGSTAKLLKSPNDNLAVAYLRALRKIGSRMMPLPILRRGASHDSLSSSHPSYASASYLRAKILEGRWCQLSPYLTQYGIEMIQKEGPASLQFCTRGVFAKLRSLSPTDWEALPDSGEGLANRLAEAARSTSSLEDLYHWVKSKRYAHARIRRLVLWAFLGLQKKDLPPAPLYLRVLGLNRRGATLLHKMKHTASIPVLTKPAHWTHLELAGQALFRHEIRCTALYDVCRQAFGQTVQGPSELTRSPVVIM